MYDFDRIINRRGTDCVKYDNIPTSGRPLDTIPLFVADMDFAVVPTYFYHYDLDVQAMQKAADYLVGEHDFKSFCSTHAQVETTVRTIYSCIVEKEGDVIKIRVTGNGFLYNMVRIIAGTLIEVGAGKRVPEEILTMLEKTDRCSAGATAPAHGLTMIGIEYEKQ